MTDPRSHEESIVDLVREIGRAVHGHEIDAVHGPAVLGHLEAARALLAETTPRVRWYEVDPTNAAQPRARNRELSAFSGALNPIAPPMRIRAGELLDGRPALVGRVALDRLREGPPHSVHGGVVAGLFDEILGAAQRLNGGPPGMTGRLTVRYRRPTPLDEELEFRGWIHDERSRRVVVRGECVVVAGSVDGDERPTAEAEAVFLRVDFDRLDAMMRAREAGKTPDAAAPLEQG